MAKRKSIEERFLASLGEADIAPEAPLVFMVSGGADSTALVRLACELLEGKPQGDGGIAAGAMASEEPASETPETSEEFAPGVSLDSESKPWLVLHVNHHLRGEASEGDAAFVKALAQELDIPYRQIEAEVAVLAADGTGSKNLEAAGREVRYAAAREALVELCDKAGVGLAQGCVLVAHTADDRVENFYMRSIVGAGPGALRSLDKETRAWGMRVFRPLLDVTHQELCRWLEDRGYSWREDATNATDDAFRAYVRHHMVPAALAKNSRLHETLGRTMDLIASEDDYLAEEALKLREKYVQPLGEDLSPSLLLEVGLDGGALHSATTGGVPVGGAPASTIDLPLAGVLILPTFGSAHRVLARRAIHGLLTDMLRQLDPYARVEYASVEAVLAAWKSDGSIRSGYVANIQGNLLVSANKQGVRIELAQVFRARRKKQ